MSDVPNDSGTMLPHAVAHESNLAGVGLMYRVVSMADFLVNTRHYGEANIDIVFHVEDTFCPDNAGQYNLSVRKGRAQLVRAPLEGVSVHGNIADLSSVLMGSVDLRLLHRFGKVEVDREGLEPLSQVLQTLENAVHPRRPVVSLCL